MTVPVEERVSSSGGLSVDQRPLPWWLAPALWAGIAVVLLGIQSLASESPALLDGWSQFDGPEYLAIVDNGYLPRQLVWFPALPVLIRFASLFLDDPLTAAVVVSGIGGLFSAVLFARWTGSQGLSRSAQFMALCALLLYPYGWFLYGVVYPDALFLAFSLGAFVLLQHDRPWLSSLLGACATAARPSGFAVVLGLLVLSFERGGFLQVSPSARSWIRGIRLPTRLDPTRWSARLLVPLLSSAGLVAYMTYQWILWGSPTRFVSEQSQYHEAGLQTLLKEQYFAAWGQGFDGRHLATTTAQAVILVVVLASVPAVGRRFGWGYGVYVAGLVALPLVSVSTFMGVGRYLIPAFPCFALLGEWFTRRRRWAALWFAIATAALLVMTFGFARSWYLT